MSAWTLISQSQDTWVQRGLSGGLLQLRDSADARLALTQSIIQAPFEAVFWECRQIVLPEQEIESAIVASPRLTGARANHRRFDAHLSAARNEPVIAFDNLGGKSRLVVPTPGEVGAEGVHLMRFLRSAPATQIDAFWRTVAEESLVWIATRPLWLSTSGLGVAWLHMRLDPRPKYYTYQPFKSG